MQHAKLLLSLILCLQFAAGVLISQNCQATAQVDLDANAVRARLPNGGSLWWDFNNAGYIVPKSSGVASIFTGGIWIGGLDPAGNLKLSAVTYGNQLGYPGPLINGQVDNDICQQFDRFWVVTRQAIDAHIADFADNGIIDNPNPAITGWPGWGNPESASVNGFVLPDLPLAPYFDANNNGFYEPLSGDYPDVKGDEAIWWMYNTGDTNGAVNPKLTFSILAYAFVAEEGDPLSTTTFYDVKLVNHSFENLDSTFIGLWVDPDLGCYYDDYVGCMSDQNLAFAYNADAVDGELSGLGCTCQGVPNYCETIPVLGIKFLRGPFGNNFEELGMTRFMYYLNPSVGIPPPVQADPNNAIEYYRLLTGTWTDGTPLTAGGTGYNSGGVPSNFAFSGNPGSPDDWSMCSEDINQGDVRMLMSAGPFLLQPGGINALSFAVIWLPNQAYPCPDISPLVNASQIVQNVFENVTQATESHNDQALTVSPNPFSAEVNLKLSGGALLKSVTLLTLEGKVVRQFNQLNTRELTFSREGLASGMYFYRAVLDNDKILTGKLIAR